MWLEGSWVHSDLAVPCWLRSDEGYEQRNCGIYCSLREPLRPSVWQRSPCMEALRGHSVKPELSCIGCPKTLECQSCEMAQGWSRAKEMDALICDSDTAFLVSVMWLLFYFCTKNITNRETYRRKSSFWAYGSRGQRVHDGKMEVVGTCQQWLRACVWNSKQEAECF